MGKWLDKLKALINFELNAPLIAINWNKNSNNQIKNENEYHYDEKKKKLEIYLDNLSEEKKDKIAPIFKDYIADGNKLLEAKTSSLLKKLYKYNKDKNFWPLLKFFKPIIPPKDYEALEASLFLRREFEDRENITRYKENIRKKFGDRGNNIANLCSAGYFEEFLMPLYNSSKKRFEELYELIMEKSVVAVFVHGKMNEEEIPEEIEDKISISKKYGIDFLHIHGIGERNVDKIKNCIKEKKEYFTFFEKNIFEKDNIIIVELLF